MEGAGTFGNIRLGLGFRFLGSLGGLLSSPRSGCGSFFFCLPSGGFFCGSSIEFNAYEAENLCKDGGVVVVSLNHRLNILGFLDLSDYGEQYHNSGNLGMEDIVAALRWVQKNIASFGGDPDNVTIFGHSGGGMKCTALMQIPAAAGLFHKAVIQSGVNSNDVFRVTPEKSRKVKNNRSPIRNSTGN